MDLRKTFLNLQSISFIGGQLVIGLLNYLFQVYASRTLETIEFGNWSQWLAKFSVACFVGVLIQSLSTLSELENKITPRMGRVLLGLLLAGLLLAFSWSQEEWASVLGWAGAVLNGFWVGVCLRQKKLHLLTAALIFGASSRFIWCYFDSSPARFYHATEFAAFCVCLTLLLCYSKTKAAPKTFQPGLNPQVFAASLSLAFFGVWVPQVDLLVAPYLLSAQELGVFAKVALLYKAFYFGFQTLAQVLLAHQLQAREKNLGLKFYLILAGLGIVGVMAGVGIASYFSWPLTWVVLGLLHMTTLCLLYLAIQDLAACRRGFWSLGLVLSSPFLIVTGKLLGGTLERYWIIVVILEFACLAFVTVKTAQKPDHTPT